MEKKQVHILIQEQKVKSEQDKKRIKVVRICTVSVAGVLMALIFLSSPDLSCFAVGVGILAFIIWTVVGGGRTSKGSFLLELLDGLKDDIKINSKIHYELDGTSYDVASKKTWEGRSMHGNYKYKSTDRWLSFDFVCTDNTKVKLDCITKYKVRKGAVIKEKYFLKIVIAPNTDFYSLEPHKTLVFLKELMDNRMHNEFDEPIRTWVFPQPSSDGMEFRIKLVQEDDPYTVDQVLALIRPVFGYFSHNVQTKG